MTFDEWLQSDDSSWHTGATLCSMFGVSNNSYSRMKLRVMVAQGILEMRVMPTRIGISKRYEYRKVQS